MVWLRVLVLVLTLGNLTLYGWGQGWFDGFIHPGSTGDREPQRLQAQVDPEAMKIVQTRVAAGSEGPSPATRPPGSERGRAASGAALSDAPAPGVAASGAGDGSAANMSGTTPTSRPLPASAATAVVSPPPMPAASAPTAAPPSLALACLESGPYQGREIATVEAALRKALPPAGFATVAAEQAGSYMLYMGRFADDDARSKKEGELRRRNAPFEHVDAPAEFARGLSLGRFGSRADAEQGLAELNRLGVRTARIVVVTPPVALRSYRVDKADTETAAKLRALGLTLPFQQCAPTLPSAPATAASSNSATPLR